MNKLSVSGLLLYFLIFSSTSVATNDTCTMVTRECENAVALAKAIQPYIELAKQCSSTAYNVAHTSVSACIPEHWVGLVKNPYLSESWVKEIAVHGALGLSGLVVVKMITGALAVPLFLVKLPFHNRVTTFALGAAAAMIYANQTRSS